MKYWCFCLLRVSKTPGYEKVVYALQQAMLHENACVVFVPQKSLVAFLYVRTKSKIYVWIAANTSAVARTSWLLDQKDTMFLIDPPESINGGAMYSTMQNYMLILAASNNTAHFPGLLKFPGKPFRYLSPWSKEELNVALPYMEKNNIIEIDVVLNRSLEVGNVPRYLRSTELYQRRKDLTDLALSILETASIAWIITDSLCQLKRRMLHYTGSKRHQD
jgi:hypothetical protein